MGTRTKPGHPLPLGVVRVAALVLLPLALLAAGGGPALGQGGTSCPGDPAPTPTAVTVDAVPIVVTSTTADYFVLYVTFDAEGTELEVPVAVTRGEAGTTTLAENLTALPAARYRVKQYQVADPADVDGDCIDDVTELDNLGSMNPVNPAMIADPNDGVVAVPDLAAFQALGTGVYGGTVLKFVLLNLDTAHPALYFMNTKLHGSHEYFFEAVGLQREGAITGTITYDPGLTVPDRGVGGFYYDCFRVSRNGCLSFGRPGSRWCSIPTSTATWSSWRSTPGRATGGCESWRPTNVPIRATSLSLQRCPMSCRA